MRRVYESDLEFPNADGITGNNTMHQNIMLNGVKEFRQIHIHAPAVTGASVSLDQMDRFMSRATGTKPKT